MIGLDVQDRGHFGLEVPEVGPIFTSLDDHPAAAAPAAARRAPDRRRAEHHRGIEARGQEDFSRHGRGRRFAVRAGNGHPGARFHQAREHLRIAERGHSQLPSAAQLDVAARHGIAIDDQIQVVIDRVGLMSPVNLEARIEPGVGLHVRTADFPPGRIEHVGQRAHAAAGNADQMGVGDLVDLQRREVVR